MKILFLAAMWAFSLRIMSLGDIRQQNVSSMGCVPFPAIYLDLDALWRNVFKSPKLTDFLF